MKGAPPSSVRAIGSLLLGKYRLETVLGEGGMGVVYAAEHVQLQERVAVKLVRAEHANTGKLAVRLVNEARATVRLKSDHVVRILDAGALEDGQPFVVMEYLEGEDLSKVREREQRLPLAQTIDYLLQACEAVAEAHSLGIVHRDLKPANLFLQKTATGVRIKVLDFGISRVLGPAAARLGATSTHSLVGSPAYASPEQLAAPELVDTRTDIWSLGVVGYELLTGKSPFHASSLALVCTRVLHDTPARLRSLRRDAPAAVERALTLALQKRADKRPQTIVELARELAPFGSTVARELLTRIELIKPAPPAPPPTRRLVRPDSVTRTLTAWGSKVFGLRSLRPRERAASMRALLVLGCFGLAASGLGAYALLRPRAAAQPAQAKVPSIPVAAGAPAQGPSPAVAESAPPRAPVPSASATSWSGPKRQSPPRPMHRAAGVSTATAAAASATASASPPAAAPATAVASAPARLPSADPYLHRK